VWSPSGGVCRVRHGTCMQVSTCRQGTDLQYRLPTRLGHTMWVVPIRISAPNDWLVQRLIEPIKDTYSQRLLHMLRLVVLKSATRAIEWIGFMTPTHNISTNRYLYIVFEAWIAAFQPVLPPCNTASRSATPAKLYLK